MAFGFAQPIQRRLAATAAPVLNMLPAGTVPGSAAAPLSTPPPVGVAPAIATPGQQPPLTVDHIRDSLTKLGLMPAQPSVTTPALTPGGGLENAGPSISDAVKNLSGGASGADLAPVGDAAAGGTEGLSDLFSAIFL